MFFEGAISPRLIPTLLVTLLFSAAHGQDDKRVVFEFTESDADTIMHGHIYNASLEVGRLQMQFKRVGKERMKVVVPALVFRYQELDKLTPEEHEQGGEIYWETSSSILGLLSKLGDPRSKARRLTHHVYLLRLDLTVGSYPTAVGFVVSTATWSKRFS